MKHAREDYDRIQDPTNLIPADEPVFLMRAQDSCAVGALQAYLGHLVHAKAAVDIIANTEKHIRAFEEWPKKKVPDLPRAVPRVTHSGFNVDTSGTRERLED